MLNFLKQTKEKVKSGVKSIQDFFKPTEEVRIRDFIREIPGASKKLTESAVGTLDPRKEVKIRPLGRLPEEEITLKGPQLATVPVKLMIDIPSQIVRDMSRSIVDVGLTIPEFLSGGKKTGQVKVRDEWQDLAKRFDLPMDEKGMIQSISQRTLRRQEELEKERPDTPTWNTLQAFGEEVVPTMFGLMFIGDVAKYSTQALLNVTKSSPVLGISSQVIKDKSPKEISNIMATRWKELIKNNNLGTRAGRQKAKQMAGELERLAQGYKAESIPTLNKFGQMLDDFAIRLNQDIKRLGTTIRPQGEGVIRKGSETLPGFRPVNPDIRPMGLSIQPVEEVGKGGKGQQTYYHVTNQKDKIKESGFIEPVFVADSKKSAKDFVKGGDVIEIKANLDNVLQIKEYEELKKLHSEVNKRFQLTIKDKEKLLEESSQKYEKLISKYLKEKGYDAVRYSGNLTETGKPETMITDVRKIQSQAQGKGAEKSLVQEAKKYKSAEEFVKAQGEVLYHSSSEKFANGKPNFDAYFGDADWKKAFAKEFGVNEYEVVLPKNKKILDLNKNTPEANAFIEKWGGLREDFYDEDWVDKYKVFPEVKKSGYDGAKFQGEYILSKDLINEIKTKSQLIDIWNKSQGKPALPKIDKNKIDPKYKDKEIILVSMKDIEPMEYDKWSEMLQDKDNVEGIQTYVNKIKKGQAIGPAYAIKHIDETGTWYEIQDGHHRIMASQMQGKKDFPVLITRTIEKKIPSLPTFQGYKDLTTKFLESIKGKETLSHQEIEGFARRPEIKKAEAELLLKKLEEFENKDYIKTFRAGKKSYNVNDIDLEIGVSVGKNVKDAEFFLAEGDKIEKLYISKNAKILKKIPEGILQRDYKNQFNIGRTIESEKELVKYAKDKGYDVIELKPEINDGIYEFRIINPNVILTNISIPAQEFADSIKRDLLPLTAVKVKDPQYGRITIDFSQGENASNIYGRKNYEEVVFESPIETNGSSHYPNSKNYLAHARGDEVVESGKKIWREQEIQSDVLQKDNLGRIISAIQKVKLNGKEISVARNRYIEGKGGREQIPFTNFDPEKSQIKFYGKENDFWSGGGVSVEVTKGGYITREEAKKAVEMAQKKMDVEMAQIETIKPFLNDRYGERILKERLKEKAQKGYELYRFPTGETIGKIEGFEDYTQDWDVITKYGDRVGLLKKDLSNAKIGMEVSQGRGGDNWIITDILGDGRFKAAPIKVFYKDFDATTQREIIDTIADLKNPALDDDEGIQIMKDLLNEETFDLTGKSNPQSIRYEKWGKFLKNRYGAKQITDKQGNTWYEVPITSEMKDNPVEAFGMMAGIEAEEDEEGNLTLSYNPMSGALGVAGLGIRRLKPAQIKQVSQLAKKGLTPDKISRATGLKLQTIETFLKGGVSQLKGKVDIIEPELTERGFISSAKEVIPEADKIQGQYIPRDTDNLSIKAKNLIKEDIDTAEEMAMRGTDDKAVATASELLKYYAEEAENTSNVAIKNALYEKAAQVANEIAPKLTEMGRAVQAASILGRLTGEGQVKFAASQISKYNEKAKISDKIPELTGEQAKFIIDEMKIINAMADGTEKAMRFQKLQDYISKLVPTPLFKKVAAVWKAGLLTGIRTSGLNISANISHAGTEIIKDIPATIVDKAVSLITGKRAVTTNIGGFLKGAGEGMGKGMQYLRTGFDERNIGTKLDYTRVNFGKGKIAKALQTYTDTVFRILGTEDQPFYYAAKIRSLYEQAKVEAINRGLRGEEAQKFINELIESPTDKMIKYASLDAEMAVFQNQTMLSRAASGIVNAVPGTEIIIPFRRTPSAVAMQVFNYSPAGIVKTIFENAGKGRFDQRLFSQGIGRGLTGIAALALGALLFKKGLLTTSRPQGEREQKLWELEGKKPNSIKIGGKWRQAQILGPVGNVLLIGGGFQKAFQETGSPTEALTVGLADAAQSFTQQTFLTGVSNFIDAVSDPSRSANYVAGSTLASAIPTIVSDVAMATDTKERRSNEILEKLMARIPGVRQRLEPQIDVLGKEREAQNPLEIMLDPTRPMKAQSTPVIDELRRLTDKGYKISPTLLGDKKGYDSLTPEENTKLWKTAGNNLNIVLKNLIKLESYNKKSDEEKATKIEEMIKDSQTDARVNIVIETTKGLEGEELRNKVKEHIKSGLMTKEVYNKYNESK